MITGQKLLDKFGQNLGRNIAILTIIVFGLIELYSGQLTTRSWFRTTKIQNQKVATFSVNMDSLGQKYQAPKVEQKQYTVTSQYGNREDPYYWLRDDKRQNQAVLDHLKGENEYVKQIMAGSEGLQDEVYKEMRSKIKEDDQSVPSRIDTYLYFSKTIEGKQYSVYCRQKLPDSALEGPSEHDQINEQEKIETLLDCNKDAEKHEFYMVSDTETSPNEKYYAYSLDTKGNEKYSIYVKDIEKDEQILKQPIDETDGGIVWANDNSTLFYIRKDEQDRPYKVYRRSIFDSQSEDVMVYHEKDDQFHLSLGKSKDKRFIFIAAGSAITSEEQYLEADNPTGEFKAIFPRIDNVEYEVRSWHDTFIYLIRDKERFNSEILYAPINNTANSKVLVPHDSSVKITGFSISEDYVMVIKRVNGQETGIYYKVKKGSNGEFEGLADNGQVVQMEEEAYSLGGIITGPFHSHILRLYYTSLITPNSVIDYNMDTKNQVVKKVKPVLGGYKKENYETKRIFAEAEDGVKVPINLVYSKKLFKKDGSNPCLLSGYGAYEISNDPTFNANRYSLIDRGFVFAIGQIRGGGDMGRLWYEDGKYLKKKNTITDFIACSKHLIAEKYTAADKLCIEGRSAGGITVGGSINFGEGLFRAAIAGVPFVDVVTTMLDETIPLTAIEWEEWGNPQKEDFYHYMLSYSPYDNVKDIKYPHVLITGGLNDPRVQYWEPAKFALKLRDHNQNPNSVIMFKCDMGAGHFSKSGRFDKLKELALEYVFLLRCVGLENAKLQP